MELKLTVITGRVPGLEGVMMKNAFLVPTPLIFLTEFLMKLIRLVLVHLVVGTSL